MTSYPASKPGSQRHTLSVLVENRPGVLARIAGLFARRAFNINSLSVSPTERPDISRVTVTADVEDVPLEQIIKQLNKLLHVLKIVDLDPATTVERELVLIKVAADESNRSDVLEIVRLFRVRVVDVNPESLTIEATGAGGKIDALLGLLEHYGVTELVRSGAKKWSARKSPAAETSERRAPCAGHPPPCAVRGVPISGVPFTVACAPLHLCGFAVCVTVFAVIVTF